MKISKVPHNVLIKCNSARNTGRIDYNSTVLLIANNETISAGTTKTYSSLATDGEHIWIRCNNATSCTYNGASVSYKKDSNFWQIKIPDNFDPTIPLVFN